MVWATIEQTTELTGRTVSSEDLARAHGIIELAAGVTEGSADAPTEGDPLLWLGRATSYQAAFIDLQPELFGSLEMQSEMVEGHQLRTRDADWFVAMLAPLAKIALARAGFPAPDADDPAATGDVVPHPEWGFSKVPSQYGDWTDDSTVRVRPRTLILSDGTEVDLP